ncbi:O-methyl transferase B, partial [Leptodontidium sp. 2 PMI_412]
ALPDFLKDTGYRNITSNTNTPFWKAFNTPLSCFEWLPDQRDKFGYFQHSMMIPRGTNDWLSVFPLERELAEWKSVGDEEERVLFVDVGGGRGQQCVALRKKYSELKGRVVLQDLKETVERRPEIEGVEVMVQDFWKPQAVKGAKFYYFRAIFHDYPDEKCADILKSSVPAMGRHSKILVDETVLPRVGVSSEAMGMDLVMMACLGSLERTQV